MDLLKPLTESFLLYFLAIDPLGTVAVFLSILPNIKYNKTRVAVEAVMFAFLILIFFMLLGSFILNHLNISLYSFKIAGGIILLLISIEMMFNKRLERKEKSIKQDKIYNSVFPLAIPLLAGPASITSVIVTSSISQGYMYNIYNAIAILLVLLITLGFFLITVKSEKFFNKNILEVISRIIGILLAALSIQFILDGISEYSRTF
ncbi:MAG: MarC family transcriptional regulator [Rickettsiales bacterium]|nr:MarC family transcriptional regulator [Rickettsiales bacterium]